MLAIEIVEGCNNKCFFCKAITKTKKFMDPVFFNYLISECNIIGMKNLDIIPDNGEPFLHKNIYEFLKLLDSLNFNVHIYTNLTLVNIKRLEQLKLKKIILNISHYGNTEEEYIYHTWTNKKQYKLYIKKLNLLKSSTIKYNLESRTESTYFFDYEDGKKRNQIPLINKCIYHYMPKIDIDGNISYCKFINSNVSNNHIYFDKIKIGDSLQEKLINKQRYDFFNTQAFCKEYCSSYSIKCGLTPQLIDYKLMNLSKKG